MFFGDQNTSNALILKQLTDPIGNPPNDSFKFVHFRAILLTKQSCRLVQDQLGNTSVLVTTRPVY